MVFLDIILLCFWTFGILTSCSFIVLVATVFIWDHCWIYAYASLLCDSNHCGIYAYDSLVYDSDHFCIYACQNLVCDSNPFSS